MPPSIRKGAGSYGSSCAYEQNTDFSFRTYAFSKSGRRSGDWISPTTACPNACPASTLSPTATSWGSRLPAPFSPSCNTGSVTFPWACMIRIRSNTGGSDRYRLWSGREPIRSGVQAMNSSTPRCRKAAILSTPACGPRRVRGWRSPGGLPGTDRGSLPSTSGRGRRGACRRRRQRPGTRGRPDRQDDVLAEGLYADLRLSPGGNWLAALAVHEAAMPEADGGELGDPRRYKLI